MFYYYAIPVMVGEMTVGVIPIAMFTSTYYNNLIPRTFYQTLITYYTIFCSNRQREVTSTHPCPLTFIRRLLRMLCSN